MQKTDVILLISIGIAFLIVLIILFILSPKRGKRINFSNDNQLDESLSKAMRFLGSDLIALTPDFIVERQVTKNTKLERIFKESGNPWEITTYEFFIIKIIMLVLGTFMSSILAFFLSFFDVSNVIYFTIPIIGLLAFFYPDLKYQSTAKKRMNQFKAELPEAIDYLIMSINGGGTVLQNAFTEVVQFLPEGVMKIEFNKIVTDLNTGLSIREALLRFSDRAPSEGIKAFSKALINAEEQDVSTIDILRNRSKASRRELKYEIEKRISKLSSKMIVVLLPSTVLSIVVVSIAPSIYFLINVFS